MNLNDKMFIYFEFNDKSIIYLYSLVGFKCNDRNNFSELLLLSKKLKMLYFFVKWSLSYTELLKNNLFTNVTFSNAFITFISLEIK